MKAGLWEHLSRAEDMAKWWRILDSIVIQQKLLNLI